MKLKRFLILLVIIILLSIALAIITLALKPDVEKFAREEAPKEGVFVPLEHGDVYYEIAGPENGPPVVLVHGSIIYNISWDKNFYVLARAGFRVLRFDLYGRGRSSRPRIAYTEALYLNQIKQVLEQVNFTKNVHLVGLSMGGALVALFAQKFPQLVKTVILVDPVSPHFWEINGQQVFKRFFSRLKKMIGKKSDVQVQRLEVVRPLFEKMRNQFKYKGIGRSIFSGIKHLKHSDLVSAYKTLGTRQLPTLLIWGELDDVIPISESKDIVNFVPQVQYHAIKNAGHLVQYEKPKEVNKLFIDFIVRNSKSGFTTKDL